MPRVIKDNITFDSQLEVQYYDYLNENKIKFLYHPKRPIIINSKNTYTPDFICIYDDRVEIIETKGHDKGRDEIIHNFMLDKSKEELRAWLESNGVDTQRKDVQYKKITYRSKYGWVDYNFKPTRRVDIYRERCKQYESEIKSLKNFKKDTIKFFKLTRKTKLTDKELDFKAYYINMILGE